MNTSPQGRADITQREGVRHWSYRDIRGIWTIGVGHTAAAGLPIPVPGLSISQAEADQIFHRDLAPIIAALNTYAPGLTQNQFDALVSLAFNIGTSAFRGSTVLRMLRAGNVNAAGRAILMWNRPPEIMARRNGEYVQFLHGEYVARIAEA